MFLSNSTVYRLTKYGTGSPESVVTSNVGGLYIQTDASPIIKAIWFKATGSGNTGWTQLADVEISALAGLTSAADKLPYFTGSGTAAVTDFSSFGRTLVALADYAALRTGAGLVIGTNVQAFHANLSAFAGLSLVADRLPYANGAGTLTLATFTAGARALVALASYTTGDLIYASGSDVLAKRAIGSSGDVLTVTGGVPVWAAPSGAVTSVFTRTGAVVAVAGDYGPTLGGTGQTSYTTGDLLYASASNTLAKRAVGSSNQVLTVSGGVPTWATPAGGGGGGSGPGNAAIATKTGNYTATSADYTLLCDATSASFTITLPAAASNTGMILVVKKIDSSVHTVTIDGNSSETIDGATTQVISTFYASLSIHCDGTSWFVI